MRVVTDFAKGVKICYFFCLSSNLAFIFIYLLFFFQIFRTFTLLIKVIDTFLISITKKPFDREEDWQYSSDHTKWKEYYLAYFQPKTTDIFLISLLTHCSWDTHKRIIGKQCRPRSDAAECYVWSGSPLFANSLAIFLQEYVDLIAGHT